MNFEELRQRYEASHADQDRIRRAIDRRFIIEHEYPYGIGLHKTLPLEISFYISSWGDPYAEPPIPPAIAFNCGPSGETADRLSARALRRIAAVKQLYEDWFAGRIPEVPVMLPREIVDLP